MHLFYNYLSQMTYSIYATDKKAWDKYYIPTRAKVQCDADHLIIGLESPSGFPHLEGGLDRFEGLVVIRTDQIGNSKCNTQSPNVLVALARE